MRTSTYTTNYQNELTQRTVPSYKEIQGTANASATVTVNGASVYRKGEFFRYELPVSNGSYGSYTPATVTSTISGLSDSSSGDIFTHPSNDVGNYDADGNLIYDGRWTYTWNAENRLVSMEENFTAWPNQSKRRRLEFVYDGNGRRIEKKVYQFNTSTYAFSDHIGSWIYVYDGWNLITETKRAPGNGSTHRTYVWGPDLSGSAQGAGGVGGLLMVTDRTGASDKHHYVGYDGNGNVAVLVDADTGTISGRYEYGPFGEPLRASGEAIATENPFRFSTKFTDKESGYLYYGFRYYNQETGRWLNRDPIAEEGGLNLYGFVSNNPLIFIDSYGLDQYKLGYDDPYINTDEGSGRWGSEEKEYRFIFLRYILMQRLHVIRRNNILYDASDNLLHFFGNTGTSKEIRLKKMINDVPDAKRVFKYELDQAKKFVETLSNGVHDITSGQASVGMLLNTKV